MPALPPLEESYRADLVPPPDVARPIYEGVVEALRDDVDLYVCETMSSAVEAQTAQVPSLRTAKESGCSFRGHSTRHSVAGCAAVRPSSKRWLRSLG